LRSKYGKVRFKGYVCYLVQDPVLSVRAIRYRRERWVTPDGQTIILAAANGVIGLARERFTKNLWSDRDAGSVAKFLVIMPRIIGGTIESLWQPVNCLCP
jgi:hypothetical protein